MTGGINVTDIETQQRPAGCLRKVVGRGLGMRFAHAYPLIYPVSTRRCVQHIPRRRLRETRLIIVCILHGDCAH